MSTQLSVSLGQHSVKGCKPVNQDFCGACVPAEPQLGSKGIVVALADGISSSDVSHIASETAVANFIGDYYCTSDAWSVKKSATRVIEAANAWLHGQTRQSPFRFDKDRGYVCTFSALVIKSATAHLFHVGDARVYRVHATTLEQLTEDHRLWVAGDTSYLSRALGIDDFVEVDYQALPLEPGDLFLLATDGIYEVLPPALMARIILDHGHDLNDAARQLVAAALEQGSTDNLTAQLVRIDRLPLQQADEHLQQLATLPLPPSLESNQSFDGYRILQELHVSHRSHVYLAQDEVSGQRVVIKLPSTELRSDPRLLERFLMEEWIARRVHSPHLLQAIPPTRKRHYLYAVFEYVEGQTLTQWLRDQPRPSLETVRSLVGQIAKGLRALHRQDMLHQDLRPDNILIDAAGIIKLIDYGSVQVAGLAEMALPPDADLLPGTGQYMAPEYFLGEPGSPRSDLYSLGVITCQLLSGRLPYGLGVVQCRTRADQNRLAYQSLLTDNPGLPPWVDEAVRKAVQINPQRRYDALSAFVHDLRHPDPAFLARTRPPLLERDPVRFWQGVSLGLLLVVLYLLTLVLQP